MASWNRGAPKTHYAEPLFHPDPPPRVTTRRPGARNKRERWEDRHTREELSRDDLLFLLSILEGELQVEHAHLLPPLIQLIRN